MGSCQYTGEPRRNSRAFFGRRRAAANWASIPMASMGYHSARKNPTTKQQSSKAMNKRRNSGKPTAPTASAAATPQYNPVGLVLTSPRETPEAKAMGAQSPIAGGSRKGPASTERTTHVLTAHTSPHDTAKGRLVKTERARPKSSP